MLDAAAAVDYTHARNEICLRTTIRAHRVAINEMNRTKPLAPINEMNRTKPPGSTIELHDKFAVRGLRAVRSSYSAHRVRRWTQLPMRPKR